MYICVLLVFFESVFANTDVVITIIRKTVKEIAVEIIVTLSESFFGRVVFILIKINTLVK